MIYLLIKVRHYEVCMDKTSKQNPKPIPLYTRLK